MHQGQSRRRRLAWDPGPLPSRPGPLGSSCRQRLGRAGVPSPGLPRCPMLSPMGWDQHTKGKCPKVMEESRVEWTLMARPPGIQSHTLLQGWVGVGGCRKGILIPSVSPPNRRAVGSPPNRGAVESPSNREALGSPPNRVGVGSPNREGGATSKRGALGSPPNRRGGDTQQRGCEVPTQQRGCRVTQQGGWGHHPTEGVGTPLPASPYTGRSATVGRKRFRQFHLCHLIRSFPSPQPPSRSKRDY